MVKENEELYNRWIASVNVKFEEEFSGVEVRIVELRAIPKKSPDELHMALDIPPKVRTDLEIQEGLDGFHGVFQGYLKSSTFTLGKFAFLMLVIIQFILYVAFQANPEVADAFGGVFVGAWVVLTAIIVGVLGYVTMSHESWEPNQNLFRIDRGGEGEAILEAFLAPSLSKTPHVAFRIERSGVVMGQHRFAWSGIGFIRLIVPPSPYQTYVMLQIFDEHGSEHRWKLSRLQQEEN